MKKTVFTGSGVAIVTPMKADYTIDYERLGELIDWHIAEGTDAIVSCGTTGESATMTDEEHVEVTRYTVGRVAGRVPVIAGVGSNDTSYAIWLSKEAEAAGADALLHVTPYYNKATQKGLVAHFTTIADATTLPVILYNVPSRTGLNILPETYRELARHPNIVAAKEANGDLTAAARTAYYCGEDLAIYSGNDDQLVPLLSIGAKGIISVLANIAPRAVHEMCAEWFRGNARKAGEMQVDYIRLVDALFCEVSPIPVKEAMRLMGKECGNCRLPLTPIEENHREFLAAEMRRLGLIR